MTNYATPTVVPQTVPNDDMTPLELLLLTNVFDADDINGEHYFYAERFRHARLTLDKADSTPRSPRPRTTRCSRDLQLRSRSHTATGSKHNLFDLSGFSGDSISRHRAPLLRSKYISVISSFTCSKYAVQRLAAWRSLSPAQPFAGNRRKISSKSCSRKKKRVPSPQFLEPNRSRRQCLISHRPPPHGSPIRCAGGAIGYPRPSNGSKRRPTRHRPRLRRQRPTHYARQLFRRRMAPACHPRRPRNAQRGTRTLYRSSRSPSFDHRGLFAGRQQMGGRWH